jgi:hypothetical protein
MARVASDRGAGTGSTWEPQTFGVELHGTAHLLLQFVKESKLQV